jgi:hypothetical protein
MTLPGIVVKRKAQVNALSSEQRMAAEGGSGVAAGKLAGEVQAKPKEVLSLVARAHSCGF